MDKIIEKQVAFQLWKVKTKQTLSEDCGDAVVTWSFVIAISAIMAVAFFLGVAPGIRDAAESMRDALGG